MNIIAKRRFLNKHDGMKAVEAGQPLTVDKEVGEKWIAYGYAVAANDPSAKDLKATFEPPKKS